MIMKTKHVKSTVGGKFENYQGGEQIARRGKGDKKFAQGGIVVYPCLQS